VLGVLRAQVCAAVSLLISLFFMSSTDSDRPALALPFARTLRNLLRAGAGGAALRNARAAVRSALEEAVAAEVAAAGGAEVVVEEEEDEEDEQASAAPLARRQRVKELLGELVDLIPVEFWG
jgi:hypothetical protein